MHRLDGYDSEDDFDYDYGYDDLHESGASDAESGYDEPSNPTVSIEVSLSQSLHDAMKICSLPQVEELVPQIENYETFELSNGWKPLSFAAYLGKPELVEFFINYETDLNVKPAKIDSSAPLTLACSVVNENVDENHFRCAELLLGAGADLDFRDRYGVTALMTACKNSTLEMVELLLSKGADVNRADNDGWSALFYAANRGELDIVQTLLTHQADVEKLDKRNRYAFTIATDKGFTHLAEIIKPEKIAASERAALEYSALRARPSKNAILEDAEPDYHDEVLDMVAHSASGMERYLNAFLANKVNLRQLLLVHSDEELKKIGVIFSWHRRTLIERIRQFHLGCWNPKSLGLSEKGKGENEPSQLMMAFSFVATLHRQIYVLRTTMQYLHEAILRYDCLSLVQLKEIKARLERIRTRLRLLKCHLATISHNSRPYLLTQEVPT